MFNVLYKDEPRQEYFYQFEKVLLDDTLACWTLTWSTLSPE